MAAAYGRRGLDEERGEPLDAGEIAREARRAAPPGPDRRRRTGTLPTAADRAASRSRYAVTEAVDAAAPDGTTVGAGVAGRSSGGTYQSGREPPSRPETWVRSTVSPTVQRRRRPSRLGHPEVDDQALAVQERDRHRRPATRPAPTTGRHR